MKVNCALNCWFGVDEFIYESDRLSNREQKVNLRDEKEDIVTKKLDVTKLCFEISTSRSFSKMSLS